MFSWPLFRATPPKLPRPDVRIEVRHEGEIYFVRVQRHSTARKMILKVRTDSGEPVLTLPTRSSLATAKGFLEKHGGWIAARLARLPDQIAFEADAVIPFRGEPHRVMKSAGARGAAHAGEIAGEKVLIIAGDAAHLPRRLTDFLRKQVKDDIARSVATYASKLNVSVARITVKDTRSRWGSCSAAGALSFSWRLIFAPPFVLDYLCAHEVAHRVEMNHSRRYWRVVADICPHWREAEAWIKRNGAGLHRYG